MNQHPINILVFDSGVGGLSIAQEIHKRLPHCTISYASDNAAYPYGTKTEKVLIDRVDTVLHKLIDHTQADIAVVACNSASTLALPTIRQRIQQPVVGVVPAIKPAVHISHTGVIGVLATPGTAKRRYTHELVNEFAPDQSVILHGCSQLVAMAEALLRGHPPLSLIHI